MGMIKKSGRIVCLLCVLLLFGGCKTEEENKLYGDFNDSKNIVFYDVGIYSVGNNHKKLNLRELPIEVPTDFFFIHEVHCVTDEKVYFSYSYDLDDEDKRFWVLASVNWDGTEIETIYQDEFINSPARYNHIIDKDYSYREGFFANDKIVLHKEGKVIEYDINTEEINVFDENDYTFPSMGYDVSLSSDEKIITINFNNNTHKTLYMDYIAKEVMDKDPELCSLYYMQMCEDKLYLYVLYNQNSLLKNRFYLYEYDISKDNFEYVYSRYWVHDEYDLIVVPVVDDQ